MSSWCTADDTSALSASGLAQSASKCPPRAPRPPFRRSPVFGEFYIHRATFRSARIRARALDSIALRHKRGENNGRSSVVTRNLGLHAIQRTRVLSDPAHSRPFGDPRSPPIPTKNPKQKPELTFALLSSQSTSSVRAPPPTPVRSSQYPRIGRHTLRSP